MPNPEAFARRQLFCGAVGAGWGIAFGSFSLVLRGGELGAGSAPPSIGQQSLEERGREPRSLLRQLAMWKPLHDLHEDLFLWIGAVLERLEWGFSLAQQNSQLPSSKVTRTRKSRFNLVMFYKGKIKPVKYFFNFNWITSCQSYNT